MPRSEQVFFSVLFSMLTCTRFINFCSILFISIHFIVLRKPLSKQVLVLLRQAEVNPLEAAHQLLRGEALPRLHLLLAEHPALPAALVHLKWEKYFELGLLWQCGGMVEW